MLKVFENIKRGTKVRIKSCKSPCEHGIEVKGCLYDFIGHIVVVGHRKWMGYDAPPEYHVKIGNRNKLITRAEVVILKNQEEM